MKDYKQPLITRGDYRTLLVVAVLGALFFLDAFVNWFVKWLGG